MLESLIVDLSDPQKKEVALKSVQPYFLYITSYAMTALTFSPDCDEVKNGGIILMFVLFF